MVTRMDAAQHITSSLVAVRRRMITRDDGTEAVDPNAPIEFSGHASVFNQPALIGSRSWGFVEWIEPGAFSDVLNDDVRFLFNHDGVPLARTTNDTLKLSEDKVGLLAEAELAPITLSRDLATLIERGDVTQMSFAFVPDQFRTGTVNMKDAKDAGHDGIDGLEEFDGLPYNVVTKMRALYDVSAVTYPAYEGTDASVKSRAKMVRDAAMRRGTVPVDELKRRQARQIYAAAQRQRALKEG